ncbi:Cupredoxin [Sistotremastrum suecicum HHB10207 ss-3]|uniref:laccase n=1 Tax=Sistotremastrum suecicum HHB10207 ss-3 TaxID=1314776 RepID=A0A166C013_9AGAM|nr:Cupredoxin [Sistotremastrum suecicum HHB10207 ss-3]
MFLTHLLFLILSSLQLVSAANRQYQLQLTTSDTTRVDPPDGFPGSRPFILTNGLFPGPLISAQKGDRLLINVANQITSPRIRRSATIAIHSTQHWHGIFQQRTSASDGTAEVTQCPISPFQSFEYQFETGQQSGYAYNFPTPLFERCSTSTSIEPIGTTVILAHNIVTDLYPKDPHASLYDVDDASTIITVGDWTHLPANEAFANKSILQPSPDSTLINGQGLYMGGPTKTSMIPVIGPVQYGKRYRFRIINVSCNSFFNISFDRHPMNVIEADGTEIVPRSVDALTIFPGQRYSVVIEANLNPVDPKNPGSYWFRTRPTPDIVNWNPSTADPAVNNAIFRYEGARNAVPLTTIAPTPTTVLREFDMVPLSNPAPPGGTGLPTKKITVPLRLNGTVWTVGNGSFFGTPVPVLMQILTGMIPAQQVLGDDNVVTIDYNQTIDLTLTNDCDTNQNTTPCDIADNHPIHLHGHEFAVIQAAGQSKPNYINPPRRDTVAVYNNDVIIRFNTLNPGPWIFHCHIDWHLSQGMALVFAEAPNRIISGPDSVILPPGWSNLCTIYNKLPPDEQ